MTPRYPDIEVQLVGLDGNAMSIMGRVSSALKKNNVPKTEVDKFMEEAMSGDYDNVIQTCMRWVDCT